MRRRTLFAFALLFTLAAALAPAQGSRPAAPRPVPVIHRDLVYATVGGQPLKLDLYLPPNTTASLPLVIHIHGGGWAMGNKGQMPAYCLRLLDLGFAVAGVQYRLTSQAGQWGDAPVTFPAQIHDVKGAVRWLRANAAKYRLDPERFAAWGESAGGHLSALLATSGGAPELEGDVGGNLKFSSKVQAAVDYFGPTDMLHIGQDAAAGSQTALQLNNPSNPISTLIGFKPAGPGDSFAAHASDARAPFPQLRKLLNQASPIAFVSPASPPLFIGHGSADPLVPVNQSRRLEEALRQAGVKTQLVVAQGKGHGDLGWTTHRAAIEFLCGVLAPEAQVQAAALQPTPPRRIQGGQPGPWLRLLRALR